MASKSNYLVRKSQRRDNKTTKFRGISDGNAGSNRGGTLSLLDKFSVVMAFVVFCGFIILNFDIDSELSSSLLAKLSAAKLVPDSLSINYNSINSPIDRNQLVIFHSEMPEAFKHYQPDPQRGLPMLNETSLINYKRAFQEHPYHRFIALSTKGNKNRASSKKSNKRVEKYPDLVDYMVHLKNLPQCNHKPIFISMARVQSDLYWQLVENFFHTMLTFGHLDCSVIICISDDACMKRCQEKDYPCFDYRNDRHANIHIMEIVAEVKLLHIGRALEAGVHVFLLDLDVGFLRNPLLLYEGFLENPMEQVRAQQDLGSHTDKATNTAFYAPRPNFGLYIVKAHPYSVKAFKNAWRTYQKSDNESRSDVAVDQNHIVNSMKWARWRWNYNFSYFHLGYMLDTYPRPIIPLKAVLLDKMSLYSENGLRNELGGAVAQAEIKDAVAVHATCHEGASKLLGLKSSNSFWNYEYYDPARKTITKPLMFTSRITLRRELFTLAYIAVKTKRLLIVPNVLVGVGTDVPGQLTVDECEAGEYNKSIYCQDRTNEGNTYAKQRQYKTCMQHHGEYYWPSWRSIRSELEELQFIEPGFYYRIETDYRRPVPEPFVLTIDLNNATSGSSKKRTKRNEIAITDAIVAAVKNTNADRIVLDIKDSLFPGLSGGPADLVAWAKDSVSCWNCHSPSTRSEHPIVVEKYKYLTLPTSPPMGEEWEEKLGVCPAFARVIEGNRTCFDKCK